MTEPNDSVVAARRVSASNPMSASRVQALVAYLEHDPQPMLVLDRSYTILAANTAYRRQFGLADQHCVGRTCYSVSHGYDVPCDQAGEHCPMQQALATKSSDRVLHIHHTPRGAEHVDVSLRPILDEAGEVVAFVERLQTVRSASARPNAMGLVGRSQAFTAALSAVQRVGPSMLPVLLQGESGTGKELFARAVHEASERATGPFVVVDCSGFSETLFESELFGYEKGAFTGAQSRKVGLVETANSGTLFLDEIGDVPLAMQVKLLRLIETGTFRRVGGLQEQSSDFRLVAATHQPLERMVAEGRFRADLYYRICGFPIHLPPLRERMDDIPLLVDSILQRGASRVRVAPDAMARLQAHDWPGNIRELRNVLERARLYSEQGEIHASHLALQGAGTPAAVAREPAVPTAPAARPRARLSPGELTELLRTFKGTRRELAEHLGWTQRTLYRRLKEAGLS